MDHDTKDALHDLTLTLRDLDPAAALAALLEIDLTVRFMMGERALDLAAEKSWQAVGEVVGTTREAAWQRWHLQGEGRAAAQPKHKKQA